MPGLAPSYANVNNMLFGASYNVRNYRFPANYYNFYPGDYYDAYIRIENENGRAYEYGPFRILAISSYEQLTGKELVNRFNLELNKKLDNGASH